MSYKIVRKKESPNIWKFFENGKLLITIDEERTTPTGNGLLTIHKTFNRRSEEIDIASEIICKKERRKKNKDEWTFLAKQLEKLHFVDDFKIQEFLHQYFCLRDPNWFSE